MTKKVIIIDDSITQLNILKSAFIRANWEVYGIQNAKTAYEMIFDVAPDLIITDAIMPVMGGFQLIKAIRENEKISKIPTIVFSVLNDNSSKFYLKEELSEYFLRKSDNADELVVLAEKIVIKHPVDDEYKMEILKTKLDKSENRETQISAIQVDFEDIPREEEIIIDEAELTKKFKENYDFSYSDDKLMSNIFSILYPILKYDLFIISLYSFNRGEKTVFFDIKDMLISPIFQNAILDKYQAQGSVLFKKYAPGLKMIVSEDEFLSKHEFSFENKDGTNTFCAFYSKEKSKWENENNVEIIKNLLSAFFRARYINKSSSQVQKESLAKRYLLNKTGFSASGKIESQNPQDCYFAIIQIHNFSDIESNLSSEEIDILNSKITERIMSCLEKDEQVYKNDEDEYNALIFAKDEKKALYKLNCIVNALSSVSINNNKPDILIGAANCNIGGGFNIHEAQKNAKDIFESAWNQEKVVLR